MLTLEERKYLTWLTENKFEGWGAIVDLGPWLGSSSAALAEGLKRRGSAARINSFDLFRWEPIYMLPVAHEKLSEGDDFLPVFLREIGAYAPWIESNKVDLLHYAWNGGPIEILFVDAAKTWSLTNAIFKGFGHRLVPGKSRVVLQDFRYYETHWLPLIFDSRPDLWREIESVYDGDTVTFVPLKPLDGPGGMQTDYSEEVFPPAAAELLLKSRIERDGARRRSSFACTLYRKYLIDGSHEEARKLHRELLADGLAESVLSRIGNVESVVVPRGWDAYNRGDFETSRMLAERCLSAESRPVHALLLLGSSLFRAGERDRARQYIDEVLAQLPKSPHARLLRAELTLGDGKWREAAAEALDVLRGSAGNESAIDWCLNVISQAWEGQGTAESHVDTLTALAAMLPGSPSLLTYLAREQYKAGAEAEAAGNLVRALALAPGHALATRLRNEWTEREAARLKDSARIEVPNDPVAAREPSALRVAALPELAAELLSRVREGSFQVNEQAILSGYEIGEALHGALNVHNNPFSVRRYYDLFHTYYQFVTPRPLLSESTIVDLGCGSTNPYGLLFLFLMLGAKRGIAIDSDTIQNPRRAVRALADLAASMLVSPAQVVGEHPVRVAELLRNLASFDLSLLHAGDASGLDARRLVFKRESVHSLSLRKSEADLIISNAFFEHIPRVEDAISELARVTRPGGIGVHVIDCSDHRRYQDPACHPLEFLTESSSELLVNGSNRIRPLEFKAMFERHGFIVTSFDAFERIEVGSELRSRMVEPFRSMPPEHLAVTIAKLCVLRT